MWAYHAVVWSYHLENESRNMEHEEKRSDYHEPQPEITVSLTQDQAVRWAETQVSPRPRTKGILQLLREALDPESEV
jgi:hypothetical protein